MAKLAVNPNRMELLKLKRRTDVAIRGHKLLKDKLDELLKKFFDLVRESRDLRREVEKELAGAYNLFALASSEVITQEVDEALSYPRASLQVDVYWDNMMGVKVPAFKVASEGDFDCYGLAGTPASFDDVIEDYAELLPDMLRLAEVEAAVRLMAMEIERTRRRVNALEHVLIPSLQETVSYITMKLDEMERSYRTQLMKIKSMQEEEARKEQEASSR
ncbi:MAG: V-type ATP synthase subunit D [Actinomycetota bacterium]|nr:V-type ATP synthase subunit D [Actinomycetota bacterium]